MYRSCHNRCVKSASTLIGKCSKNIGQYQWNSCSYCFNFVSTSIIDILRCACTIFSPHSSYVYCTDFDFNHYFQVDLMKFCKYEELRNLEIRCHVVWWVIQLLRTQNSNYKQQTDRKRVILQIFCMR